jgi:hypothetical protein
MRWGFPPHVLEPEDDHLGAIFFRIYVDPLGGKSDAEVLSRPEYQASIASVVVYSTSSPIHSCFTAEWQRVFQTV